ncbi:MAG: amidohydrolase family protein [Acidimicrobiales bacterium]
MHSILRGATVVDGTGGPSRPADVEVVDGYITSVGTVAARDGAEEIDLTGLVLSPGFVDIHTHFDAQVFWDRDLTPSSWHGVTTVVQGNCGFGIAPARPADRQLIMETLELVEGMQVPTLQSGINWSFETFPQYLDALRTLPKRINVAAFVPHSMVRLYVMGAEAAFSRAATDDELAEICRVIADALQAGAIGISTSQAPSHQGPQGKPVPSRFADKREIRALVKTLAENRKDGIIEITYGPLLEIEEVAQLSAEFGVRITWGSVLPGLFGGPGSAMAMLERGVAAGGQLWPQTSTRYITTQMSMANPYQWSRVPAFAEVLGRGHDAMAAAYSDSEWRTRAREQTVAIAGQTDFLDGDIDGYFLRTSVEETDVHESLRGIPLATLAAERGEHPLDVMLDLALKDNLVTRFRNVPRSTKAEMTDLVKDHRTVLGAHDAAAHVDMLCDSCYPSYTLRYWVREEGALTLEEAIWRMSGQPAALWGLSDRGVIAPGKVADMVAFNPDTISETPFERLYDFPANGDRLVSRSKGIEHIWVGGVATRSNGVDVDGAAPGVLVS